MFPAHNVVENKPKMSRGTADYMHILLSMAQQTTPIFCPDLLLFLFDMARLCRTAARASHCHDDDGKYVHVICR